MNEYTLKSVLEQVCLEEAEEFRDMKAGHHFFSLRHRKAMKKILKPAVETHSLGSVSVRIANRKRLVIIALVILLALLGISAGAIAMRGFQQNKYTDHTKLFSVNAENCPKTIESIYSITEIPSGYELYEKNINEFDVYISYQNKETGRLMTFEQNIKDGYNINLNTEQQKIEELDIDGHYAIYLDSSSEEIISGIIIMESDDYVFKIFGDFDKYELIELVKSIKNQDI